MAFTSSRQPVNIKVEFLNFPAMKELFRYFPQFFNTQMNAAYKAVARSFMSHFEKTRLTKDRYNVRRTFNIKRKRGQPNLTRKAIFAGFRSHIFPLNRVHDKELVIRAASPLLKQREFGATIRAKKSEALFIRGPKKGRKQHPKALAMTKGGSRFTREKKYNPKIDETNRLKRARILATEIVARKQSIFIKPSLGFRDTWAQYLPKVFARIQKGRDVAMEKALKKKDELFAQGKHLVRKV